MHEHTTSRRVFRVKIKSRMGDEWKFVQNASETYRQNALTDDPLATEDLSTRPLDVIVKWAANLASRYPDGVELVDVTITTKCVTVDFNSGDLLEHRRKVALAKLDQSDIEALNVEKLAAYNKLKFHGEK